MTYILDRTNPALALKVNHIYRFPPLVRVNTIHYALVFFRAHLLLR